MRAQEGMLRHHLTTCRLGKSCCSITAGQGVLWENKWWEQLAPFSVGFPADFAYGKPAGKVANVDLQDSATIKIVSWLSSAQFTIREEQQR